MRAMLMCILIPLVYAFNWWMFDVNECSQCIWSRRLNNKFHVLCSFKWFYLNMMHIHLNSWSIYNLIVLFDFFVHCFEVMHAILECIFFAVCLASLEYALHSSIFVLLRFKVQCCFIKLEYENVSIFPSYNRYWVYIIDGADQCGTKNSL